jgi:uncharacterized protein (TIGR02246 family)
VAGAEGTTKDQNAAGRDVATEIEEGDKAFQDAVNSGDLEGVVNWYEPNAVFVPEPNQVFRGRDEIRKAFAGFMDMEPKLHLNLKSLHHAEDIALGVYEWSLDGKGPEGNPASVGGETAVVFRRQADGRWLLLIDNAAL